MKLNEKIKSLREDRDLKQKEIAKILNTSTQYYQKYEKGLHPLPTNHLKTLCEYYEVSADDLLDLPENLPKRREAKYKKGEFNPMTKKEIIERFYNETISTIRGAEEQGFNGSELIAIIEHEINKTKELLMKIG